MVSGMGVSLPRAPHVRPPTAPPGWGPRSEGVRSGAGRELGAQLHKSLPGRARGSEGS